MQNIHKIQDKETLDLISPLLTKKQKKIIELRLSGLKNKDVAAKLGINEDSASHTYSRAIGKLKKIKNIFNKLQKNCSKNAQL